VISNGSFTQGFIIHFYPLKIVILRSAILVYPLKWSVFENAFASKHDLKM
jgi:hypothetical protein